MVNRLRVLFRKASNNNSFLVTERCDNYCVMCSQPPRRVNDDYLVDEIAATIPHLPKNLHEVGFTGGEPTLLGDRFLGLLRLCKEQLPASAVHVLTNGRSFSRPEFARSWASVAHPDLMAGIPIYSDQSTIHDFVVQADGAFDETIRGILNLKKLRQRVEIRMVMHRHTIGRLEKFAEFIVRNLPFVDHVALMGLELMGFAKANADDLWIDPRDYADTIANAAQILSRAGLRTSIYNLPLCVLNMQARPFAIRSISDWKREYWAACEGCILKDACGGAFFSSRDRLEPYISAKKEGENE
jgi:His-Xaa-Ser system radical SAM maturase HxsC